jgi:SpoIID/LytB domain protein
MSRHPRSTRAMVALVGIALLLGMSPVAAADPVDLADLPASASAEDPWTVDGGAAGGSTAAGDLPAAHGSLGALSAPSSTSSGFVRPPASPAPLYFQGGGWGHGVGLSQWGAQDMALRGSSHSQILSHYHTGSAVQTRTMPTGFRVGLRSGSGSSESTLHFPRMTVTAVDGPIQWSTCTERFGGCSEVAQQPAGATWVAGYGGGSFVLRDAADTVRYVNRGGLNHLRAQLGSGTSSKRVTIAEKAQRGYRWGALEVRAPRPGFAGVRATIDFGNDFEKYVYGIAEVPFSWHREALRAQAVAARSYAVVRSGGRADCDCWVTDGPENQVYYGADRELGRGGTNWRSAADDTRGRILTHSGNPISTFYSSSHNRRSENVRDVWGSDQPYHRSVNDPYSQTPVNPYRTWTATVGNSSLAALVPDISTVTYVRVVERTDGGTPSKLEVHGRDSAGRQLVQVVAGPSPNIGRAMYSRFGLRSSQVDVITPSPFTDTQTHALRHHVYDIAQLARLGLTDGCGSSGRFCPDVDLTRAEMAAFLWRMAGQPQPVRRHTFPDVRAGTYYDDAVSWLQQEAITNGWGDTGRFEPNRQISRGQMAAFLYRLAGEPPVTGRHPFTDVSVRSYADRPVTWMYQQQITDGWGASGQYRPEIAVTRAQMASFALRFLDKVS